MKPFWGIDITENKKNERMNGDGLLVKRVSARQAERFDSAVETAMKLDARAELPTALRILRGVCGVAALLIAGGIMKAWGGGTSLAEGYANAPYVFWAVGVCALVWLVLALAGRRRSAEVLDSREGKDAASELDEASESAYAELGVPAGSPDVDILSVTYRVKDGEIITKDSLTLPPFMNFSVKVFEENGMLCLADVTRRYEIPLSSLRGIRTVDKAIFLPQWLKDTPPDEGEYKQYKLTADGYERIRVKPYHILEFEHEGELWGVYFPNYELPRIEELVGR